MRLEERANFRRMATYYRRQMHAPTEYVSRRGAWLDSLTDGSTPGRKRSVDVLITRSTPTPFNDHEKEERLAIEVLSIETNDPSHLPGAE